MRAKTLVGAGSGTCSALFIKGDWMVYWERKNHCWLSDGRLMGFFANLTLDGGLIRIRVLIRYPDGSHRRKERIVVCKDPEGV